MASKAGDVELPVLAPQGAGVCTIASGIQSMAQCAVSDKPKISLHQVSVQ